MYYLEIFIFNIFNIKKIQLNILNALLFNLNKILINFLVILLVFNLLVQLKGYILWVINIYYLYYINTKDFNVLYNFYLGYYKIHPIILYFGLLSLYYKIIVNKSIFKLTFIIIGIILVFAFILGSLWGLYQIQWGSYWSNDSIEIILIFFIIILFKIMHTNYINSFYKVFYVIQCVFLLLCLRYNVLYTKHNFFTKIIKFNIRQYLIYSLLILLFVKPSNNKYYFSILNYIKIFFYFFIIQVFYNFINIKIFIHVNNCIFILLLFYFLISIILLLKKKLILHIIIFLFLITFNLFCLNYQKKNIIYINFLWLTFYQYMYYSKTSNFIIFVKLVKFSNINIFNNILLENKIFNLNQYEWIKKISIINYY